MNSDIEKTLGDIAKAHTVRRHIESNLRDLKSNLGLNPDFTQSDYEHIERLYRKVMEKDLSGSEDNKE